MIRASSASRDKSCHENIFHDRIVLNELLKCYYWKQTKLIQLWNVILDGYQSRGGKNLLNESSWLTRPAMLHMNPFPMYIAQ
jgi:hypothetical protein